MSLLEVLAQGPTSGQALADRLGVSRTAVWKSIQALRAEGCVIEAEAGKGYRLLDASKGFGPRTLSWRCERDVVFLPECASTNREAFQMGLDGVAGGTLVVAERQTAGKGRLGRRWVSEDGLTFSLLLRPALRPAQAPLLCLAAALGVAEALDLRIKWPNDVWDDQGRKVAGILAELNAEVDRLHFVVLGVGVNVNQTAFPPDLPNPVSLAQLRGHQDRAATLGRVVTAIERRCAQVNHPEPMLEAWRRRSVTLGQRVRVGEVQGYATDVRADGALVVQTDHGPRPILAGDVEMVAERG